ncbi:MAG TPA: amidohydrolase family protein [bacterium]|nr:amidohydrolase family protein [bacterium]
MIFDINTSTGHWPFRRVPNEKISELERLLKGKGIGGAAVVNTHGLFYKNCHDANLELSGAISDRPFFAGVATLNPLYPAWERDLQDCAGKLGMKGLRIVPQYHNYQLSSPCAREILAAAVSLSLPVFIPVRVVDVRQRHWLDTGSVLGIKEIGELSLSVPGSRIIVTECPVYSYQVLSKNNEFLYPGLYFEISRMGSAYGQEIARLAGQIGAERLLFGSGSPFKEVTPALLKLKSAGCTDQDKEKISHGNSRVLLGL